MKKHVVLSLCALCLPLILMGADISGKWSGSFVTTGPDGSTRDGGALLNLKQNGSEITGTAGPNENRQWSIRNGKIEGNHITFEVLNADDQLMKFDLQLVDGRIKGEAKGERDGTTMKAVLDLAKAP